MTLDEAINILQNTIFPEQRVEEAINLAIDALKTVSGIDIKTDTIKNLEIKLKEAQCEVDHYKNLVSNWQSQAELSYRDGVIYGLKYATRCNGVSGGEVRE